MNQLEALTTMLDATVEMDDRPHVRRARKVLSKMADRRRAKRERRFASKEPWGSDQHDCPKCGVPGSSRGASTNRTQWVQVLKCPACKYVWDRLYQQGEAIIALAYTPPADDPASSFSSLPSVPKSP